MFWAEHILSCFHPAISAAPQAREETLNGRGFDTSMAGPRHCVHSEVMLWNVDGWKRGPPEGWTSSLYDNVRCVTEKRYMASEIVFCFLHNRPKEPLMNTYELIQKLDSKLWTRFDTIKSLTIPTLYKKCDTRSQKYLMSREKGAPRTLIKLTRGTLRSHICRKLYQRVNMDWFRIVEQNREIGRVFFELIVKSSEPSHVIYMLQRVGNQAKANQA